MDISRSQAQQENTPPWWLQLYAFLQILLRKEKENG